MLIDLLYRFGSCLKAITHRHLELAIESLNVEGRETSEYMFQVS